MKLCTKTLNVSWKITSNLIYVPISNFKCTNYEKQFSEQSKGRLQAINQKLLKKYYA